MSNLRTTLITLVLGLIVFMAADALWLGLIMKDVYQTKLGHLMAPTVTWWAVAMFYPFYTTGIYWFVVRPYLQNQSYRPTALNGAFLGGLAYAAYDLTNQATLLNWPIAITVSDILWGSLVTTLTALAMKFATLRLARHG
ncbi:MAG: DUF2177 domain-containing protein [Pseudomonas fluorescens]|nr:MAG: DUF2177 domain-containing protein [Pseudomonas fluorescens]